MSKNTDEFYYSQGLENSTREKYYYSFQGSIPIGAVDFELCKFETIGRPGSIQSFIFDFFSVLPPPGSYEIKLFINNTRIPQNQNLQLLDFSTVIGQWVDYNKYFARSGQNEIKVQVSNTGGLTIYPIFKIKGFYINNT